MMGQVALYGTLISGSTDKFLHGLQGCTAFEQDAWLCCCLSKE